MSLSKSRKGKYKIEEEFGDNRFEAGAVEDALRILARIIAREWTKEIASDTSPINQLLGEPAALSCKVALTEQLSGEGLTLTPREVAELLKIGQATVYAAIRSHQIPSIRFGKRILIPRAALMKLLAEASG